MKPCECCRFDNPATGFVCVGCKHNTPTEDRFAPEGKCASCQYDPRLHGICAGCVDYDKYQPGQAPVEGVTK